MPVRYGFTYVNVDGFAAFNEELAAIPWRDISSPDPSKPLAEQPTLIMLKNRLTIAIEAMLAAMGISNMVREADRFWDSCQTRLAYRIGFDEHDMSPERSAIATRLRSMLLQGSGTAQTALDASAEVDFGRAQVAKCLKKPISDDIAALGYEPLIQDIKEATQRLAEAIGRDLTEDSEGQSPRPRPATPRSAVIRKAASRCVSAFNAALDQIDFLLEQTDSKSSSHDQLKALRASLQDLLDRHPSTGPVKDPFVEPEPTPGPLPVPVTPTGGTGTENPGGHPFLE